MSFIGLLRVMGVNLLIALNFHGALSEIVGGQPCRERMMIDRHEDESKRILFALAPLCVYIRSYF